MPDMERQRAAAFPVRRVGPSIVAAAWIVTLGCATPQQRQPLPLQSASVFSATDGLPWSERWWNELGDPRLNATIERALAENFSLRAAFERLREAEAIAARTGAARSPTLEAIAASSEGDASGSDPEGEVNLGLEASYEVDLWGRIRSDIEAQRLEATATAEDVQAAALSLSAEVARTVYRLTEAASQLALLDSQLRTNRDVLAVIESRFAIGQSGSTDVLRQRQLVEATVEQQIVVRAAMALLEHRILVLLGAPPQQRLDMDQPASLPELADLPAIGLPTDLLRRRPDVRAAYLRLESADAAVAAAVKDQYPSLNLGAAIATAAENPSGLFSAWITSLSGQLLAPIIDGGRRRHEVERAVAVRRQRLAAYGETVLASFQEVEDALAAERYQVARIANLDKQLTLATTTYKELRNQYLNGAADFIDVLVALGDQQDLERSVLSARLERIEQRIALYRAIAGGFLAARDVGVPAVGGSP